MLCVCLRFFFFLKDKLRPMRSTISAKHHQAPNKISNNLLRLGILTKRRLQSGVHAMPRAFLHSAHYSNEGAIR